MAKVLRVTLEIPVNELPEDEIKQARIDLEMDGENADEEDGDETQFFDVDAYEPSELADVLENAFYDEAVREMFAGSNIYVRFGEDVSIVSAEWAA